ncbi:P-type conjugative transfer protein VirB9 [Methylocystis sp.]|uniref:P-type conjugative transfer protein VirB9 n=1 Tax=Methylocystis sp. TaxID=1911079 RepID=UPI003DA3A27D
MTNRFSFGGAMAMIACGLLLSPFPSHALQQPMAGSRDARMRMVAYDPFNVVKINGVIRASTQVVFSEDEEIAHVAIGDSVSWEVAPAGNILFLKPRERHPPTNLQVVTTRRDGRKRSYQFELSIAESSLGESYFLVRFAYPGDAAEARRYAAASRSSEIEARAVDETFALHNATAPRNWSYSAQGTPNLEPDAVYDDGKETTLRFEGNREVPAIFLVASDGTESIVPKDVRGELVVVHAVGRELRLRQGAEVLCIFNEAFDPVGVNRATRTTSPSVARLPRRAARAR